MATQPQLSAQEFRDEVNATRLAELAVKVTTNYVKGLMLATEYLVEMADLLATPIPNNA